MGDTIVLVGDGPHCGRACLPMEDVSHLMDQIVELQELVQTLRNRLAGIAEQAASVPESRTARLLSR